MQGILQQSYQVFLVTLLGPFYGALAVPCHALSLLLWTLIDFTLPFTRCRYCRTPPAL